MLHLSIQYTSSRKFPTQSIHWLLFVHPFAFSSSDILALKVQASWAIRALGWRASCRRAPGRLGFHGPQHSVAMVLRIRKVTTMNLLSHSAPLSPITKYHSVRRKHGTTLSTLSFTIRLASTQSCFFPWTASKWAGAQGCWWYPTGPAGLSSAGTRAGSSSVDPEMRCNAARPSLCTGKRYLVCARFWAHYAVSNLFLSCPANEAVILLCMWFFSGCGWTNWPSVTLAATGHVHFAWNWGWAGQIDFFSMLVNV
jgi:hypothetical protein